MHNAAANGVAEASVKRIKLLLDRHTEGYAEWHKILPLAQQQLNHHTHSGTGVSPYMALFGREPVGMIHLENPETLAVDGCGSEWLAEVRVRTARIHEEIKKASDELKQLNADAANVRRASEKDPRAGKIRPQGWVRIIRGSMKEAEQLRKHGHGEPWKHRYRVLEVRPHAVRLEVPKDGSVPAISEWQLIRRCEPSPARLEEPADTDPKLTEDGIPVHGTTTDTEDIPADPDDPDQVYEIERILSAKKEGGRYMILVKWTGYADATYVPRKQLLEDCEDPEIVKQVADAVERHRLANLRFTDDEEPDTEDERNAEGTNADETDLGRGRRQRRSVMRYSPTNFLDFWDDVDFLCIMDDATEFAALAT